MGRMEMQRMALMGAVTMARTAVIGVRDDSTDSEVMAADYAVETLQAKIDAAEDLPEGDADVASAQGTLTTLASTLAAAKTSRMAVLDAAREMQAAEMAKTGMALRAALAGPDASMNALNNINQPVLAAGDLRITAVDDAGSLTGDDTTTVPLKAGDAAMPLGSWNGTQYAHTDDGTNDREPGRGVQQQGCRGRRSPSTVSTVRGIPSSPKTATDKGHVSLVADGTVENGVMIMDVMASDFTHSGTQTHDDPRAGATAFLHPRHLRRRAG